MKVFVLSFFISSIFLNSPTYAQNSTNYQMAYNECVNHGILYGENNFAASFAGKTPEEQAHYCVDILQKKKPELLKNIDINLFKQGFSDGRYRQKSQSAEE